MNKRKVTKRIAAWFMCLAMVSTTVNLPAFVVKAEDPTSDEIIYDVNINGPHHLKYDEASETYICQDEDCGDEFEPGYYNIYGECDQEDDTDTACDVCGYVRTIPGASDSADSYITGSCGENATYKLFDNGTLLISGTGAIYNHAFLPSDFMEHIAFTYADKINKVIIEEGINQIGLSSFASCKKIESVEMADSVTEIGGYAFSNCSSLNNIKISDKLEIIGDYAFNNCIGLSSVIIPNSINNIGKSLFGGCSKLEYVTMPCSHDIVSIMNFCPAYEEDILSINYTHSFIRDGSIHKCSKCDVTGNHNFSDYGIDEENGTHYQICSECGAHGEEENHIYYDKENEKHVPNCIACGKEDENLNQAGATAYYTYEDGTIYFYGTGEISPNYIRLDYEYIDMNYSLYNIPVVVEEGIISIDDYMFENCSAMHNVVIPNSVIHIGEDIFYHDPYLDTVKLPCRFKTSEAQIFNKCWAYGQGLTITYTHTYAADCKSTCDCGEENRIAKEHHFVGEACGGVCEYCGLFDPEAVHDFSNDVVACKVCGRCKFDFTDGAHLFSEETHLCVCGEEEPHVTGSCGYTVTYKLYDCGLLIISGTGDIYEDAFNNNYNEELLGNIKTVVIEEGVTTIGAWAFNDCANVESIRIPTSVTTIQDRAFSGLRNMKSIVIPNTVTTIGNGVFSSCAMLEEVTLPDDLTYLSTDLFEDCTSLKSIMLPENLNDIGYEAFKGCTSLAEINFPDTLGTIGNNAFYNCTSLTEINFPDALEEIGESAFQDCDALKTVTLGDNVYTIGECAFYDCDSLEKIFLGAGLSVVGYYAFADCKSLLEVTFPCSVEGVIRSELFYYDREAFYSNRENPLTVIVVPGSKAEEEYDSWFDLDIAAGQLIVSATGNHDFLTSPDKCSICGFYADLIGAKLAGYSLSLHDNIGVDFYMELADSVMKDEGAKFIVKLEGDSLAEIPVSEARTTTVNGNTYYVFECRVAAAQMTSCISAKIVLGDGTEGTEYQFTVQEYAEYILEHESNYADAVPVVKAMLNYGAAAQNYFGYNTDSLANEILNEADCEKGPQAPDLSAYVYSCNGTSNDISFVGTSLILESEVSLKCYFLSEIDLQSSNVSVKYGDKVLDTSDYQIGKNGNVQYVIVTGLTPADYGKQFTFTVQDISVENVSAYGYMAQAFKQMGDSDKLTDLLKNMYAYGEAYKKCYKLL